MNTRWDARLAGAWASWVIVTSLLIAGCGGGGRDGRSSAPPTVSLSGAASFSDFVNQVLPRYFNASTVNRLRTYDNDFYAFSDTTMLLDPNGEQPLFSRAGETVYDVFAAPGQGFSNEHPDRNGEMTLTPTANSRIGLVVRTTSWIST